MDLTKLIKANGNKVKTLGELEAMKQSFANHFEMILRSLGYDVDNDQQIRETPARVARAYVDELLSGCFTKPPKMTVFDNEDDVHNMVVLSNIELKSLCSHHFLPFTGIAHVAYVPNKKLVGVSKLARVVEWYARRPQIQEELTKQIADFIEMTLDPMGVAVIIEANHMCMSLRGVSQPRSSRMRTAEMRGNFNDINTRNELYNLIGEGR